MSPSVSVPRARPILVAVIMLVTAPALGGALALTPASTPTSAPCPKAIPLVEAEEPPAPEQEQEQEEAPMAVVAVESKEIVEGAEETVAVTVRDVPQGGLVSFQGSLAFDPAVIAVTGVEFPAGFDVQCFYEIEAGQVRFAATMTAEGEPLVNGEVLRLTVRAVGPPEAVAVLAPDFEIFHDVNYQPIPFTIEPGTITIVPAVNEPPVADFEFSPEAPSTRDTIQFTDRSSDPDGEIVRWLWDFGDGTTSTEPNPTHRYTKGGVYTVTLTVTDNRDGTATVSKRLFVFQAPPPEGIAVVAYPNPARTRAHFRYFLPEGALAAQLLIFDLKGRPVLARDLDVEGRVFTWDLRDAQGRAVPNGPYFYLVRATTPQGPVRSRVEVLIVQR